MANKHVSKVIYGGKTLIDLTNDTIAAKDLLAGKTAHDRTGATITGTCSYDSDTSKDTATANDILLGATAHVRGSQIVGEMPNNGSKKLVITERDSSVTIPQGYHDGSGNASISEEERAKLIEANIRQGVTVLGITGTMTGTEDVKLHSKTATPKTTPQTILPDDGYNGLSQVTVEAIPYKVSDNPAGGLTATIG